MAKSSRGSLYHHFSDKRDLFRAVYDNMHLQILHRLESYPYSSQDRVQNLIDGCVEYLRIFTERDYAKIILLEGPNVLGTDYCQAQDRKTAYKALKEGVAIIIHEPKKTLMITDFLSGTLDTYAMRIATGDNPTKVFQQYAWYCTIFAQKIFG